MSVDYVFDKSAALWKTFAESAAEVVDSAGERIEDHKPTIVAVGNALLGSYFGYRLARKEPHEFWEHLLKTAPRSFLAIRGSQHLMDIADDRLDRRYGYKLRELARHTGIWSSTTAVNALAQLEQLRGNAERQGNFASTSAIMLFASAVPSAGVDVIIKILDGVAKDLRRSSS